MTIRAALAAATLFGLVATAGQAEPSAGGSLQEAAAAMERCTGRKLNMIERLRLEQMIRAAAPVSISKDSLSTGPISTVTAAGLLSAALSAPDTD